MFSGIVEEAAKVVSIERNGGNINLTIQCTFTDELKIDQSVAHNGVCLTVVAVNDDKTYVVTAIQETLDRSNLGQLKVFTPVNFFYINTLGGSIHVTLNDMSAKCVDIEEVDGSKYFKFQYTVDKDLVSKGYVTVEKGSVTVNGVSLTVCDSEKDSFRVAIIPYTFTHTNFCNIKVGDVVNIEFDIIGKYLARLMQH